MLIEYFKKYHFMFYCESINDTKSQIDFTTKFNFVLNCGAFDIDKNAFFDILNATLIK